MIHGLPHRAGTLWVGLLYITLWSEFNNGESIKFLTKPQSFDSMPNVLHCVVGACACRCHRFSIFCHLSGSFLWTVQSHTRPDYLRCRSPNVIWFIGSLFDNHFCEYYYQVQWCHLHYLSTSARLRVKWCEKICCHCEWELWHTRLSHRLNKMRTSWLIAHQGPRGEQNEWHLTHVELGNQGLVPQIRHAKCWWLCKWSYFIESLAIDEIFKECYLIRYPGVI